MYTLKHALLTGLVCLCTISLYSQNDALFSVESTTQGILIPSMTETERNAISTPSTGLLIFQNTNPSGFYYYDGSQWVKIVDGSASVSSSEIADNDGDTKVQTEESADEDLIRFDLAGTEKWVMNGSRLEPVNSGRSLFLGKDAGLNDDLSSNFNIFLGDDAGKANTTGFFNIGIGFQTLMNNVSSGLNTGVGYRSLSSNISGGNNAALGAFSMLNNISGSDNIALGASSMTGNTSGFGNTAIGKNALQTNTTGSYNTAIGFGADILHNNLVNATAIGYNAKVNTSNSIVFGGTGANSVNVGIGTDSPGSRLHIEGSLKIVDGTEGMDKVLISDNNGLASWQSVNFGNPNDELQNLSEVLTVGNSAGNQKITNLMDPMAAQDAATKNYVDLLDAAEAAARMAGDDNLQMQINADMDGDPLNEIQDLNEVLTEGNSAGNKNIIDLLDPVNPQDAATKAYVDDTNDSGTIQPTDGNSYNIRARDEGTIPGNARGENSVDLQTSRALASQVAAGNYSTISGGQDNQASGMHATVSGGFNNTATGVEAFIGGGRDNSATGIVSSIVGGVANSATNAATFIGAGTDNTASGLNSGVVSGLLNESSGEYSGIMAGTNNISLGNKSFIGAGEFNQANQPKSTAIAGRSNLSNGENAAIVAGDDNETSALNAFVGAGTLNTASASNAFVGAGDGNTASGLESFIGGGNNNIASAHETIVVGGRDNSATGIVSSIVGGVANSATNAATFVGAGTDNTASGLNSGVVSGLLNESSGEYSGIMAGTNNVSLGNKSFIGAGDLNQANQPKSTAIAGRSNLSNGENAAIVAGDDNETSALNAFVGAGTLNTASASNAFVGAGDGNTASGLESFIGGGNNNIASAHETIVVGGRDNSATGIVSSIVGGVANSATNAATFVGAGTDNTASGLNSGVVSGLLNESSGEYSGIMAGTNNVSLGNKSFIGAGDLNQANQLHSTAIAGNSNLSNGENAAIVAGNDNETSALNAFVGAGSENTASDEEAAVVGGSLNTASGEESFIGGGRSNQSTALQTTIAGGGENLANANNATIGGGYFNAAGGVYSTVGGGISNNASNEASTVAGGATNSATGMYASVLGGFTNTASGDTSTIAGGRGNMATMERTFIGGGYMNTASERDATVAGGEQNTASGSNSFVGGGEENTAEATNSVVSGGDTNLASGTRSTVSGGGDNIASGLDAVIGGGYDNRASGDGTTLSGGVTNETAGLLSTIGGGINNLANAESSTIGGGDFNGTFGEYSTIPGGQGLTAVSLGETVVGLHNDPILGDASNFVGTDPIFVVGNGTDDLNQSNALVIEKEGDVGIGTNEPDEELHVVGNIKMVDGNEAAAKVLTSDANGVGSWQSLPDVGDVDGPASSTDNAVARFDGTTGKIIQNSNVIIDDSGNLSGVGNITLSGTVDGVDVSDHAAASSDVHGVTGSVVGTSDTQTLSNKTLTAPQINDSSSDHQYILDVSELTADRTIALPLLTGNDTLVFEDHPQTLTNKTISAASNTITGLDHGSDLSGLLDDDHTQYALLAGRATGQTLIGGTAAGDDLTLQSTSDATKGTIIAMDPIQGDSLDSRTAATLVLGNSTATKVEIADSSVDTEVQGNLDALEGLDVTGNITVTGTVDGVDIAAHDAASSGVHGVTGSVVGTSDTQTLSNKTLTAPQINDSSADHQYILGVSELTANRTAVLPLLTTNDTLVFEDHPQTLTNKTISAASNTITGLDHGSDLAGLLDDDHTQYALLAGRATGQSLIGGTAAGDDLTLSSTSDASKGTIIANDPIEVDDLDSRTATTLVLGKSTATKVEISDTGVTTEVQGNLDALEGADITGELTATAALRLFDNSAPATPAGSSGLYSNSGELTAYDDSGNFTVISPHNFSLMTPSEDMAWSFYSKNEAKGLQINVDMLKQARLIESLTGEKLVYLADLDGNLIEDTNKEGELEALRKENQELKERLAKIEEALGIK